MAKIYEKLLKKVAHFQVENPYLTVGIILVLSIMILGGVSQVKTVASLEQMMPKDVEEISAFNVLRDNDLGQDMIAIVIQTNRDSSDPNSIMDIRNKKVYEYTNELTKLVEREPDVIETYSYSKILDFYSQNSVNDENYYSLIDTQPIKTQLRNFINDDSTISIIIVTTDISADDSRMNLLSSKIKELISDVPPPRGTEIKLTGTPIIQQKLGELINADRTNTQWISLFFVFTITVIIFRSLSSALVPIIVVYTSINWLYGTMGYANLPISTLAGGVAAMVIGIGIDFSIHIINKFKYERKNGNSIKNSVELAITHTGKILTVTSLTTISAFLAFLIGAMPEMGKFGVLMAIGIGYSLVFSIFGLPALLIIEERFVYYLKSKFKFGIEGEFHLEENK
ncbi:MAG: MMPL family transporter [Candidatus Woesearchaeota archaeon]|nr:MMPL family transporter [Candidatus Woesearchaeota archaeon]